MIFLVVTMLFVLFAPLGSGNTKKLLAAPLSLTFEATPAAAVSLDSLASRSQCGVLTKQGVGPYKMSGTDSRSLQPYSYVTDVAYGDVPAQLNESYIATASGVTYTRVLNQTFALRSGVLKLTSSGSITTNNTCQGRPTHGATFGPEVYSAPFSAVAGQGLSFNWAAEGGGDDYEVYAFLVKVSPSGASYDYGGTGATLLSNTTLLTHGRGKLQGTWKTSIGLIPSDGYYRFRFVNGSYDATGGAYLGATMYVDANVLVGLENTISFAELGDRVTKSTAQTLAISASTTSGGVVTFSSSTTTECTVGSSTSSGGSSTATVTLLANRTGLCSLTSDSVAYGDYVPAGSVSRSFTLRAAATKPSYSGGTSVSGSASVGSTMTAVDGSWADGGSTITNTGYQWQVCPVPASCVWANVSATTNSYLVGSSDLGKRVRVLVTKTNNVGSTTSTSSESATVVKGTQASIVLTSVTVLYGSTLQLASSGGTGSGVVTFAFVSGTCSVNSGVLTPGIAGSPCVVSVSKAADSSFNSAVSVDTSVTVTKATQSALQITSLSGTFGSSLTLTTGGGSGTGNVTYVVVSGACGVSGAVLTATAAGSTCVVRATKATDSNYLAEPSVDTSLNFARGAQASLIITTTTATYGSQLDLGTSGGSGTGDVSYVVVSGDCTVAGSFLTPGDVDSACVVRATKAQDANYNVVSSADTNVVKNKSNQSTLRLTSTSATFGATMSLTSSGGGGVGDVSYVVVSGTCTVVRSTLTVGIAGSACVVRATKAQDTNYKAISSADTTVTVSKASQSGLKVTSPVTFVIGSTLALTASGGQSEGSLSWSLNKGTCVLANATLTSTKGGITCSVEVTRAGDSNYNSSSVSEVITVEKIPQSLVFKSAPPSSSFVGGTYTTQVDSDASLAATLVIASSSTSVCSISAGVVSFNAVGTCLVSASQSGNDTYASAAASQSILVGAVAAAMVPVSTVPSAGAMVPVSAVPSAGAMVPEITVPQKRVPRVVSTSSTVPQKRVPSVVTTTSTLPADPGSPALGPDGKNPALEAGKASAVVRGKPVKIQTSNKNGKITLTLPGNVLLQIGTTSTSSGNSQVSADGVLRAYSNSEVNVSLAGLASKSTYTVFMFSDPVELGRGETSVNGEVESVVIIPRDAKSGQHTFQFNGVGIGNEVVSVSMGFEVLEREDKNGITIAVILLAVALALLGGRPIFKHRRRA